MMPEEKLHGADQELVQDVADYFRLALVPDLDAAENWLQGLREAAESAKRKRQESPEYLFKALLPGIIDTGMKETGRRSILIPLTGGLDSRGLLGAALQTASRPNVSALTFAGQSTTDLEVASATAQRAGVRHHIADPNGIDWRLEDVVQEAAHNFSLSNVCCTESGLRASLLVDRYTTSDTAILSGFFGDAITGGHLPFANEKASGTERLIGLFLQANQGHGVELIRSSYDEQRIRDLCRGLLRTQPAWKSFPGASPYDILDFGIRQGLRIRGNVPGDKRAMLTPYTDPAWLGFWLRSPFAYRIEQSYYRYALKSAFPTIFEDVPGEGAWRPPRSAYYRAARKRLRKALRKYARPPAPSPTWTPRFLKERGDPRLNASLERLYQKAAEGFDKRGVFQDWSASAALERFLQGDVRHYNSVHAAVSAEVNILAGNIPAR
ncbi:asparagine synthase-related protein [Halorhodospira neutriphila]|uniref:Asparagine synthetase domain-containing protein n=1 Tax=Halorhodospira neutriphila TaxID=168379 RepID=A0ABS1E673_9GAMM|nr:asparagine synthase-related protein [Halorhodospira neutriphila]MBK1727236.1 hypothetical protein [Halorhodospira neutriphila]